MKTLKPILLTALFLSFNASLAGAAEEESWLDPDIREEVAQDNRELAEKQQPKWYVPDVSGYNKTSFFVTQTTGESPESAVDRSQKTPGGEDASLFMNRWRLNLKWNQSDSVKGFVSYDQEILASDYLKSGDFQLIQSGEDRNQLFDAIGNVGGGDDFQYRHKLYRGYVDFIQPEAKIRVGRQQIPWGVGHFFTPTDIFNSIRVTQIEPEERQGVDAISVKTHGFAKAAMDQLELVMTPRHGSHTGRFALRAKKEINQWDVSFLGGGRSNDDGFIGFDLSGNVGKAALRSEAIFVNAETESDYTQFTVNMDTNFPGNIYGLAEYHFNGQGQNDPSDYETSRALLGDIIYQGKHYLGLTLGKDITPLWRAEAGAIVNLSDSSVVFIPELKYQIKDHWIWSARFFIFAGDSATEFGSAENLFYTELQYLY